MAEIIKVYKDRMAKSVLIGKKFTEKDRNAQGTFSDQWNQCFADEVFKVLEPLAFKTPDGGSYIGLCRCTGAGFEYWIGMFCLQGTPIPHGFSGIEFDAMDLAVCLVYGKESTGELYGEKITEACLEQVKAKGWKPDNLFFERYQCPRFTNPDEHGNVILDNCFRIAY